MARARPAAAPPYNNGAPRIEKKPARARMSEGPARASRGLPRIRILAPAAGGRRRPPPRGHFPSPADATDPAAPRGGDGGRASSSASSSCHRLASASRQLCSCVYSATAQLPSTQVPLRGPPDLTQPAVKRRNMGRPLAVAWSLLLATRMPSALGYECDAGRSNSSARAPCRGWAPGGSNATLCEVELGCCWLEQPATAAAGGSVACWAPSTGGSPSGLPKITNPALK